MITARWEILLSPGTVISMSIRGARFTRNSIDKKKPLVNTQYGMLDKKTRAALIRRPIPASSIRLEHALGNPLRNKKNLIRVQDPLPPFPEGSLPHRYICQVNKDSLRGEACQEQEFRTDNPLLRSSLARLLEEVELLLSPRAVCL